MQYQQAPPLSVPLRFFLTAPAFAIVAALLLLWYGPAAFDSRWSFATLALTHSLTLGFLLMSMTGAALQILPVVVAVAIPQPRLTASLVHGLLTPGIAILIIGFCRQQSLLFVLALSLLLPGLAWFLIACGWGLWRSGGTGATLIALRLAFMSLLITLGLGALLAGGFALALELPMVQVTHLHAAWGLLGWLCLLVFGVAYQVVPMFQVTPAYPDYLSRRLAPFLALLLSTWSAAALIEPHHMTWQLTPAVLIGFVLLAFALSTLKLQQRRKRRQTDATVKFWRAGMLSLIASVTLWGTAQIMPAVASADATPLIIGVLFIVGFGCSVVNGMLYKIVPFLLWLHLQSRVTARGIVPNVKLLLPERHAGRQFWSHLAALLLLLAAAVWPEVLSHAAAIAFGISSAWLWINLLRASHIYRQILLIAPKYFRPPVA